MIHFVNRETEMTLINNAFSALLNYQEKLLYTPIIDFYGVEGIGKTAIVKSIEQKCFEQGVSYITIEGSKSAYDFSRALIEKASKYFEHTPGLQTESEDLFAASTAITHALVERGTVVILLDGVDATNQELLERIARTLNSIIDENKVFVVITSKRSVLFDTERSVARKLITLPLKPFTRKSAEEYLDSVSNALPPEIRSSIFEWTRGYPLAMQVMTNAILENGLNPRDPQQQHTLLAQILERVVDQGVLKNVALARLDEYKSALLLLSVPRRFNLVIMQELIENFLPALKKESSIAYMQLPNDINHDTDILHWNRIKAGFSIDAPIRGIFLLQHKIEYPDHFLELNHFLAALNKKLAAEVPDSDRRRYLREYLYHSAFVLNTQALRSAIKETIEAMGQESPLFFDQFREEFIEDDELKEILGEQEAYVLSLLYQHLASLQKEVILRSHGDARVAAVREYFFYTVQDPQADEMSSLLRQRIAGLLAQEEAGERSARAQEILQDMTLREVLGGHFELFSNLIQEISLEG